MNEDIKEMFTVEEALQQVKQQIQICEQMGETSIRNERNKVILNYITNLQKENDDYKSRNEKAIEYLIKWGQQPDADMYMEIKEYDEYKYLLNILQGGDE